MPKNRSRLSARIKKVGLGLGLFLVFSGSPPSAVAQSSEDIRVYRSIMDPKSVSDIFGKRIGKRYVAIQVTITNRSKEFQYLIHDISLDLKDVIGEEGELSSRELSILRGVAEKGQVLDIRNVVFRVLRGAGTIAAGLIGLNIFGSTYPEGVAVFNGPVVAVFAAVFPDFTVNQLIRLNDSAYVANAVIPRQQAKVVVVFLPQRIFMDKRQRKQFWKEPMKVWDDLDLRKLEVLVDGNHIVETEDIPPMITTGVIDEQEQKKFAKENATVRGYIVGRFLAGSFVNLLTEEPGELTVELDGVASDTRLDFVIKSTDPVQPGVLLEMEVVKGKFRRKAELLVNYQPE